MEAPQIQQHIPTGIFNRIREKIGISISKSKLKPINKYAGVIGYYIAPRIFVVAPVGNSVAPYNTEDSIIKACSHQNILYITFQNEKYVEELKIKIAINKDTFSMNTILEITKKAFAWLQLNNKTEIAIELDSINQNIIFTSLAALMVKLKYSRSAVDSFEELISKNVFQEISKSLCRRYCNYIDTLIFHGTQKESSRLILNQIIITTIPDLHLGNAYLPIIEVAESDKKPVLNQGGHYKDANYIIFSDMEITICGDTTIMLYYKKEGIRHHVFSLSINSLFYTSGLYRFTCGDIESNLPTNKVEQIFNKSLAVDLFFDCTESIRSKKEYSLESDIVKELKGICNKIPKESQNSKLEKLIAEGYNQEIVDIYDKLGNTIDESRNLINNLIVKGCRDLKNNIKLSEDIFTKGETIPSTQEHKMIKVDKVSSFVEPLNHKELLNYTAEIVKVDILQNPPDSPEIKHKTQRIASIKKSKFPVAHTLDLVAAKPLSLTPLKSIKGTIFEKTKLLNIPIDIRQFERSFCISKTDTKAKLEKKYTQQYLLDSKRVFFVALATRHLELKGILPSNLREILLKRSFELSLQDLINARTALPTKAELAILQSSKESMSPAEVTLCDYGKHLQLNSFLSLLIYERTFIEEISIEEKNLLELQQILFAIERSDVLKFIFKVILEFTNLLNYTYSTNKKQIEGFKLESLKNILSYKYNRASMLSFVLDAVLLQGLDYKVLVYELKSIKQYSGIEFGDLLNAINLRIEEFKEKQKIYKNLCDEEKSLLKGFFGFASQKLINLSGRYLGAYKTANTVKKMFGEGSKSKLGDIFNLLDELVKAIATE